jgi:DNA-binding CsgD family transcriptional regulator
MLNMLDPQVTCLAQEDERRQMAHELHESVVQSLSTLVTDLECFRTHHLSANGGTSEEVAAKLEVWQELARESLSSMRHALGLISSSRAVYNREQVAAPRVGKRMVRLVEDQRAGEGQSHDGLTSREMETLMLVAKGMVAKEIARMLTISEKTVRNHISSIYRKLDIYDRSQVVIYAMKKGLLDLNEV